MAGLGWLVANATLAFFQIPPLPMPMLEQLWIQIPLPTAMVVLGIAAGILIGVAGGAIAALTGAVHRRRAHRLLGAGVREVAGELVVAEVDAELGRAAQTATDLASADGRG